MLNLTLTPLTMQKSWLSEMTQLDLRFATNNSKFKFERTTRTLENRSTNELLSRTQIPAKRTGNDSGIMTSFGQERNVP